MINTLKKLRHFQPHSKNTYQIINDFNFFQKFNILKNNDDLNGKDLL